MDKVEQFLKIYKDILQDIAEEKNLHKHLEDVEAAIANVDDRIAEAETNGKSTKSFDTIKTISIISSMRFLKEFN